MTFVRCRRLSAWSSARARIAGMSRARNEDHYLVVRLGRHQETLATSLTGD